MTTPKLFLISTMQRMGRRATMRVPPPSTDLGATQLLSPAATLRDRTMGRPISIAGRLRRSSTSIRSMA